MTDKRSRKKGIRWVLVVALSMAIAIGFVFVVRRRTLPGWIGCQSVPSRQARVSACVVSRPFKEYRKEILDWVERERFQIDNLTDVAIFASRGRDSLVVWDGRISDETGASITHEPGVSSVIYTHTPGLVDGIANRLRW